MRGLGLLKGSWGLGTRVIITVNILIFTYNPQLLGTCRVEGHSK